MTKARVSLSINPEVWDLFKERYPNQASSIIEKFIRDMIRVPAPNKDEVSRSEIEDKIKQMSEVKAKQEADLKALQLQLEEAQKKSVSAHEKHWIQTTGKNMLDRVGIDKAFNSFKEVHNRYDMKFVDFKELLFDEEQEDEKRL